MKTKITMGIITLLVLAVIIPLWFDGHNETFAILLKSWMSFLCLVLVGINVLAWKLIK
jgi:hypothetical protein